MREKEGRVCVQLLPASPLVPLPVWLVCMGLRHFVFVWRLVSLLSLSRASGRSLSMQQREATVEGTKLARTHPAQTRATHCSRDVDCKHASPPFLAAASESQQARWSECERRRKKQRSGQPSDRTTDASVLNTQRTATLAKSGKPSDKTAVRLECWHRGRAIGAAAASSHRIISPSSDSTHLLSRRIILTIHCKPARSAEVIEPLSSSRPTLV